MSQIMAWQGTTAADQDDPRNRIQGMRFLGQALRTAIESLGAAECGSTDPAVHAAVFVKALKEVVSDGRFFVQFIADDGEAGQISLDGQGDLQYQSRNGPRRITIRYELDGDTGDAQEMTIGGSTVCTRIESGPRSYVGMLCEELGLDPAQTNDQNLVLACVSFRRCR